MFYICESVAASPLPVSEEKIRTEIHPQHVRFVAAGVEEGWVVFGGPRTNGDGGAILIKAPSEEACRAHLAKDPMLIAGAQSYHVSEFHIFEHNPCLDPLLADE